MKYPCYKDNSLSARYCSLYHRPCRQHDSQDHHLTPPVYHKHRHPVLPYHIHPKLVSTVIVSTYNRINLYHNAISSPYANAVWMSSRLIWVRTCEVPVVNGKWHQCQ